MLEYINKKLIGFITPVLLFCIIFFAGCSSSKIETVDSKTLIEDHEDIDYIRSFKLKNGKTYNNSICSIYMSFADSANPEIIYNGPGNSNDTASREKYNALFQSFRIAEVLSAKVKYEKSSNPLGVLLGGIAAAGIIVYIFWANGERNKRKSN